MNVVTINRSSNFHGDYYGIVRLSYDEIVMIANAIYKYNKNTDSESVKQDSGILGANWNNFRDMVCYGKICNND